MTLGPIEHYDTKSSLAYDAIKTSINEGHHMPGQKIGISQMAKLLNTSDIPVREAMHRLSSEGLLEYAPHVGFRVTLPEFENYTDVYEVRQLLEGEAVGRAAANISPSSLAEIKQLHMDMLADVQRGDTVSFSALNYRFHSLLFTLSGNPFLVRQIEQAAAVYPRTRAIFAMYPGRIVSASQEHEEIIRCLEQKDSTGTRKAYLEHMVTAYALLLKYRKSLDEAAR